MAPTSGATGTSVTATGTGFTPTTTATATHNLQATQQGSWQTALWVQKFTGLPVGGTVSKIGLFVFDNGSGTRSITNNYQAGNTVGWLNDVWVEQFTALPTGQTITSLSLNVQAAAGHVRIKVYNDTAGAPSNLLGQSNSIVVGGTGVQVFPVTATIPKSGKVWAGFETDDNTLNLKYTNPQAGILLGVVHVYGTGPDPYGGGADPGFAAWMQLTYAGHSAVRVKVYQDDNGTGGPSTLLGESGSVVVATNGQQNFTVSATIPASGNVWAGFETNSSGLSLKDTTPNNSNYFVLHTYGTGPSPFGTALSSAVSNWLQITYTAPVIPVTLKWDGSTLTTTPASIGTDSLGGFTGLFTVPSATFGTHTVNASDTGGLFDDAPFTVAYAITNFVITGYVIGPNGFFPYPVLTLVSSSNVNMTELALYNATIQLSDKIFSPPLVILANTTTTIPWNFTDSALRTGSQTYTEAAHIQQGTVTENVTSNAITLTYGSTSIGNLSFNQTNPTQVPIWFIRGDSGSNTRLSVIFPNAANLTCNLAYQTAQTNHTYYNIPKVTYDTTQKNSSFLFMNSTNDFIKVNCTDLNNHANQGQYVLTITNFPFIQQIQNFRSGMYGTHGQFGMIDIITLSVVIFSMIGFNRINEAVGAFFSLAIIGATAYFGILTFPGIVLGAVAVVTVIAVTSVRRIGGF